MVIFIADLSALRGKGDKTYELLCFYVNVGVENGRIKKVYVLKEWELIIDVIAYYEFENAENFANSNLTLIIDEIIKEEY